MIDDVEESFGQSDIPEQIEERRRIQATLRIIKGEVMQDKPLQCVFLTANLATLSMADADPMSLF